MMSDDDEDNIIISPKSSPKNEMDESCTINDFSSPFKNDHDDIVVISSPEVESKRALTFSSSEPQRKKRRSLVRRNLLKTRPSLDINISKRSPLISKQDRKADVLTCNDTPTCSRFINSSETKGKSFQYQKNKYQPLDLKSNDFKIIKQSYKPASESEKLVNASNSAINDVSPGSRNVTPTVSRYVPISFFEGTNDDSSYRSHTPSNIKEDDEILDASDSKISEIEDCSVEMSRMSTHQPETNIVADENEPSSGTNVERCDTNKDPINRTIPHDTSPISLKKALKKGTLLQRIHSISSSMKKDAALCSHELNVGLRTCYGPLVSDMLRVISVTSSYMTECTHFSDKSEIALIKCTPLSNMSESLDEIRDSEFESIILVTSDKNTHVTKGNIVVVHFPVTVVYNILLKKIIVFADNRIQVLTRKPSELIFLHPRKPLMQVTTGVTTQKILHRLKSRSSKNILDGVVGYCLLSQQINTLELKILHLFEYSNDTRVVRFLAVDSEDQFCIIQASGKLDKLSIDLYKIGGLYTFVGFNLSCCFDLNRRVRCLAEYYLGSSVRNEFVCVLESSTTDWKITYSGECKVWKPPVTPIEQILHENIDGKRFRCFVISLTKNGMKYFVADQDIKKPIEIIFCDPHSDMKFPSPPFFLDGIFIENGFLTFDEYSMITIH